MSKVEGTLDFGIILGGSCHCAMGGHIWIYTNESHKLDKHKYFVIVVGKKEWNFISSNNALRANSSYVRC